MAGLPLDGSGFVVGRQWLSQAVRSFDLLRRDGKPLTVIQLPPSRKVYAVWVSPLATADRWCLVWRWAGLEPRRAEPSTSPVSVHRWGALDNSLAGVGRGHAASSRGSVPPCRPRARSTLGKARCLPLCLMVLLVFCRPRSPRRDGAVRHVSTLWRMGDSWHKR